MTITIGYKTDIGRVREMNQDSFAVLRRNQLLDELDALIVVADGMGGGKGGEVASRITAETVPDVVLEYLSDRRSEDALDIGRVLRSSIVRANGLVRNRQVEKPEYRGMGTTCVAAVLIGNRLTVGNAGDSRAYLLRDGKLSQLTDDHSEVWEQVKAGKMTREEANKSRHRNVVTQGIGLANDVTPDIETLTLADGDTVLLCSDGLTTEVPDIAIARILAEAPTPQESCDRLVAAALNNTGSDNITVIVLRYGTFVPLTGSRVTAPMDIVPVAEEEETTDPTADWRKPARPAEKTSSRRSRPVRPEPESVTYDEDDEDDFEERPSRSGRRRREDEEATTARGRLASLLSILLLCLVLGEAVALYVTSTYRTVTPPVLTTRPKSADDLDDITTKDLFYDSPDLLTKTPVRPEMLTIDPVGDLVVASEEGKLLKVTPEGKSSSVAGPPLPPLTKEQKEKKPQPFVLVAYDVNYNRYQTDPKTKSILKFDAGGTRRLDNIGKGEITIPTALTVARNGDIYLIQDHRLMKLTAHESASQIDLDKKVKENGSLP